MVGYTIVTRESEWDDTSRDEAEALHLARLMICPDCGNPIEVCSDPNNAWYPGRRTCYVSAVRESRTREFWERHREAKANGAGLLPTDGVTVYVSPVDPNPDEDF